MHQKFHHNILIMSKSRTQKDFMFSIIGVHDTLVMVLIESGLSKEYIEQMDIPGRDVEKTRRE